jgi:TolA-binding protein
MSTEMHRRISSAIAVRWTPALAARVGRRIEHRLARRRRRRRVAAVALALLGTTGFAFAFTHPWTRRQAAARSPEPAGRTSPPPAAPPPAPELAPAPTKEPPAANTSASASSSSLSSSFWPPATPARHVASAERRPGRSETVAALFAAADAARLAGRPTDAVAPLTAIFTRHPDDPRAAVAAYQLGRVLAFDLHDRARAAAAFARAHDLDPRGPLAADAAAHASESGARVEKERTK